MSNYSKLFKNKNIFIIIITHSLEQLNIIWTDILELLLIIKNKI